MRATVRSNDADTPARASTAPPRQRVPDGIDHHAQAHGQAPAQARAPFSAIVLVDPYSALTERLHTSLTAAGAVDIRFASSAADLLRRIPAPQHTGVAVLCRSPRAEAVTGLVLAMRQRGWRRLLIACQDGGEPAIRLAIASKVRGLVTATDSWSPSLPAQPCRPVPAGLSRLSQREIEVLQSLADGRTNNQTGALLGVSGLTVKSHLARIGRKIGTGDRAEMIALAMRAGIIT